MALESCGRDQGELSRGEHQPGQPSVHQRGKKHLQLRRAEEILRGDAALERCRALLPLLDITEPHLGTDPLSHLLAPLPASFLIALSLALPRAASNLQPGKGTRGLTNKDENLDDNCKKL